MTEGLGPFTPRPQRKVTVDGALYDQLRYWVTSGVCPALLVQWLLDTAEEQP